MPPLKVLVACEYSGRTREAFRALGHDAWSCDFLESEDNSPFHYQCDVREVINNGWDVMIAHPSCRFLAVSGARWFKDRQQEQAEALDFVRFLLDAPIKHIALENPVSVISTKIRKPDCIIQPYEHGDPFMKTTCLWLKNLPPLKPTNIVEGREQACWKMGPSPNRWKERSRTYPGIAKAIAKQYGDYANENR